MDSTPSLFDKAKERARKEHRPVFVMADGELTPERTGRPIATAWPNGTITTGDSEAAARDIARRLTPPMSAA